MAHLKLMQKDYRKSLRFFDQIPQEYRSRDDVATNLAMTYYMLGKLDKAKLLPYILSQLIGASIAGSLLLVVINSDLSSYESLNNIVRGDSTSYRSAVMFGEFFPNFDWIAIFD